MENLGADKPAFEPIVASGKSSSLPHYFTQDRKIIPGILLIDAGACYKGYNADLTRTFFLGNPDRSFKKKYNIILKVQQRVIDNIKPGLTEEEVWENTILYLEEESEYFTHGTGHGVGIDIHEEPYFRSGMKNRLAAGMVVTVEPGIYYPNWGGIRIEDLLLVTENGCTYLSKTNKELSDMIVDPI